MVESTRRRSSGKHDEDARRYGPFAFECDAFGQRYDDCLYLPMNHDELYVRFAEVWPEVLAFIADRPVQRRGESDTAGRRSVDSAQ